MEARSGVDSEICVYIVERVFIELILPTETKEGSGPSSIANLLKVSASVNDVVEVLSDTEAPSIVNGGSLLVLESSNFGRVECSVVVRLFWNLFGIINVLPDGNLKLLST